MTLWLPPLHPVARSVRGRFPPLSSPFRQAPSGSTTAGYASAGGLGLQLDVVFNPNLDHQLQLRLDEIDMLLLAHKDLAEEVAGHEVADPFAIGDRLAQLGYRQLLEPKIA